MATATTTPLDIKHKEFNKAVRGYAMHEVDEFLDKVNEELERLRKEVGRLQLSTTDRASDETIARTLVTAQRTADRTVESAEARAKEIIAEAQVRASTATADAEQHAREVTDAADLHAREVKDQLSRRRLELERAIDALRAFERDYRGRLRECVAIQMKALEDAAPAGPIAPPMPALLAESTED
jgi:cell division initiation protein